MYRSQKGWKMRLVFILMATVSVFNVQDMHYLDEPCLRTILVKDLSGLGDGYDNTLHGWGKHHLYRKQEVCKTLLKAVP